MKRRDRRPAAAIVLSAALIAPAFAFSALDAGQRQLLAPLEDTWNELDEAIRAGLEANAAHWQALPPAEQRALVARMPSRSLIDGYPASLGIPRPALLRVLRKAVIRHS